MAILPRDYRWIIAVARDPEGRKDLTEEQWQAVCDLAKGKLSFPTGKPPLSSRELLHRRVSLAHEVLEVHAMYGRGRYDAAVADVAKRRGYSERAVRAAVTYTKKHHADWWKEVQEQARQMWASEA
jgi:hypothetical protein